MARRRRAVDMIERMSKKRKLAIDLALDEKPISVVVEASKFYIHQSLLRNHSDICRDALLGAPSAVKQLVVGHASSETFSSFSEWLYSGSVAVAEMQEELDGRPEVDLENLRHVFKENTGEIQTPEGGQRQDGIAAFAARAGEATLEGEDSAAVDQPVSSPGSIGHHVMVKREHEANSPETTAVTVNTEGGRNQDTTTPTAAGNRNHAEQEGTTTEQDPKHESGTAHSAGPWWMAEGLSRQQRVFARLVDLYIFGHLYSSLSFRREVMLMLQRFIAVVRSFPRTSVVKHALDRLGTESPLCKYLLVCYSAVGEGSGLSSISTLNTEFLAQIISLLYKRIEGHTIPQWKEHWCDFHEHPTEDERKACEQERLDDVDVRRKLRNM